MATKTLTITEEAYEFLKRQKREGQSFSQAILTLKESRKPNYREFIGMLNEEEAESIRHAKAEGDRLDREKEGRLDARRRHLVSH